MTPERAKQILGRVWGSSGNLTAAEAAEIEADALAHENAIDTCQRIAGDAYDWRSEGNWEARRQHFAKYV